MLDEHMINGASDALARFGIKVADMPPPEMAPAAAGGVFDKIKSFGRGQVDAAKALFGNLRAGFGGASPHALPAGAEGPVPSAGTHRGMAVGNLKTLAPSLLAGGALYMLHRRKKQQQEQAAQQQAMMQQGGGYPPM
jgi:hypothetical protein